MKIWNKKSWCHLYQKAIEGQKTHDIRLNEGYEVGDVLILNEYDNAHGAYTGRSQRFDITYITSNKINCAYSAHLLKDEYVILSISMDEYYGT